MIPSNIAQAFLSSSSSYCYYIFNLLVYCDFIIAFIVLYLYCFIVSNGLLLSIAKFSFIPCSYHQSYLIERIRIVFFYSLTRIVKCKCEEQERRHAPKYTVVWLFQILNCACPGMSACVFSIVLRISI